MLEGAIQLQLAPYLDGLRPTHLICLLEQLTVLDLVKKTAATSSSLLRLLLGLVRIGCVASLCWRWRRRLYTPFPRLLLQAALLAVPIGLVGASESPLLALLGHLFSDSPVRSASFIYSRWSPPSSDLALSHVQKDWDARKQESTHTPRAAHDGTRAKGKYSLEVLLLGVLFGVEKVRGDACEQRAHDLGVLRSARAKHGRETGEGLREEVHGLGAGLVGGNHTADEDAGGENDEVHLQTHRPSGWEEEGQG